MADEKRPSLTQLRKRAKTAQGKADDAAAEATLAKERARDLAVDAEEAYAELDREEWAAAQESLGIAREDLDLDRMLVTTLPTGPTHDVTADGVAP